MSKTDACQIFKQLLETCAIDISSLKGKGKVAQKKRTIKRKMSGYNCFVKSMVAEGQPFKQVVKSRAWSTLPKDNQRHWNNLAERGCTEFTKFKTKQKTKTKNT